MSHQKTAVAYYRTSSAANVGEDKDSEQRQKVAVYNYAKRNNIEIVREYYDAAVKGADSIDARPGFADMMAYMLSNGARTIIVENAGRFARDLIIQETGYQMLKRKGIELIASDSPESFASDTPTATFIRQVLGAASEFDKAMLVEKLRGARDRKSAKLGRRIEGNPQWLPVPAEHLEAAVKLSETIKSLRGVSAALANQGILSRSGKPYTHRSIQKMLKRGNINS